VRSGRSRFAESALAGRCPNQAWGACGTVRALAEIAYEDGLSDGMLDRDCLLALRARFLAAGHVARIRLAWPAAARAPHLAGGLALLIALLEEYGIETVLAAQAGLRVGAIWELHRSTATSTPPSGRRTPEKTVRHTVGK
jgi:exopolyphosphatase/guanosine-5'-triphosphate,3'-diphosphate pyrophosphatase